MTKRRKKVEQKLAKSGGNVGKEFGCCKFNSIFDDHDVLSLDHVHF